ncbi:hypothetical protein [Iningainema tapete]|uniref:Uncharacterized protein n=1 Tax=Iningainema tapete BLCC-T55 TaxID=2748662 RepID=A0A8J6XEU4_9CYAN|nr:hypothetical protein [Iningainema tapete]MBD2775235.1 hypothetical protein [Iningainema tapete BLCC-T55]
MVSQNVVQIHEFSRELIDVSQKDGRYVSGGFGKEVGVSDVAVPEEIQQAVNKGDFRINDNYPPQDGEYALIARDINEYSVLAVATRQIDDKGERPLVAYRYFWLEKSAQYIDGVGTLLLWWLRSGKPCFEFQVSESSSKLNSNAQYYTREDFDVYFQQCSLQVVEILSKIKHYPYVFKPESFREFLPWILHTLALQLQKQYDTTLSWAWNVRLLDYPERFLLIYCADEKAYQENTSHIKTRLKSLISPTSFTLESEKNADRHSNSPIDTSNVTQEKEQREIDKQTLHLIKKLLLDIARDNETQISHLATYLDRYPSANWDWDAIVDKITMSNSANYYTTRYRALLTILGYIKVPDWLNWWSEHNDDNDDKKSLITSLTLQKRLIVTTKKLDQNNAYRQLLNYLYAGIIELLLKCHSLNTFYSKEEKKQYQAIEWLLVKSNSIWCEGFDNYAFNLVYWLIREEQVEDDSFYNKIGETFKEREEWKQKYKFIKHFPQYTRLAYLFAQQKNYCLSAFFYQLSDGRVPAKIYDRDYVKIIPTTRVEPKERNWLSSVSNLFSRDTAVHFAILFSILSLISAAFLIVENPNLLNEIHLQKIRLLRENK